MNQKNDKGQRHGLWEFYHMDGKLRCKCNYLNGLKHGLWESYYQNGKLWYKGNFLNGKLHGPYKSYFSNGNLSWNGLFQNHQRIGLWLDSNLYSVIEKHFYL